MLLNAANLRCHLADDYGARYALHCIALCERGAVSSDGRYLLFVPYPDLDAMGTPLIEGINPASPPPVEPFIITAEDAAQVANALLPKKTSKDGSYYWTEIVQAEVAGDTLMLGATDLDNAKTLAAGRAYGEFPRVGAVIPDFSQAAVITLDLDRLLKVLKTLRAASKSNAVTLRIVNDETGLNLSCSDGVAALLMPMEPPHAPDGLAVLRSPEGGLRDTRDDLAGAFAAPPTAESEMLPPQVFTTGDE